MIETYAADVAAEKCPFDLKLRVHSDVFINKRLKQTLKEEALFLD